MVNKRIGYGLLLAGATMLFLSFLTRNFASLLLSLALMSFASIFLFPSAKTLGVAAGSTFSSVAVAEIIMGFFLPPQLAQRGNSNFDANSDYANSYFTHSADLGPLANPGVHTSRKLTDDREPIYDVRYSIGADGFRLTPHGYTGADGTTRINFFGGSFTFGEGLNDNETLPYFVASTLPDLAVKNYGFHGYGPHQALAILQGDRDTKGDINLLMTSPWHAQRAACVPVYSAGAPRFVLAEDGRVVRDGVCQPVVREKSAFEIAIHKVLRYSNLYRAFEALLSNRSQNEKMDLYLAIVSEMARLSASREQQFVIGYVKADDKYFIGVHSNRAIFEAMREFSDAIIDLTLAEEPASVARDYYIHELDRHPSALANKKRAQLVSQLLVEQGLVPVHAD